MNGRIRFLTSIPTNLGTPRAVTDTATVLWRWEGDAFGDMQPSLRNIKMPLRMAGQYADPEVGLFYNYFRDYDPANGRYSQSDPIGLAGGLNTYGYVGSSPLSAVDPKGESPLGAAVGGAIGRIAGFEFGGPLGSTVGGIIGGGIGDWATGNESSDVRFPGALAVPNNSDTAFMDNACPPSPGNQDPCKGIRAQLNAHRKKLEDYLNDPLAMDNRFTLFDALKIGNMDRFWKIRAARIESLLKQIAGFERQLKECEKRYGKKS